MIAIDIPMPKSCEDCPFGIPYFVENSYECCIVHEYHYVMITWKPNWCPLQELEGK